MNPSQKKSFRLSQKNDATFPTPLIVALRPWILGFLLGSFFTQNTTIIACSCAVAAFHLILWLYCLFSVHCTLFGNMVNRLPSHEKLVAFTFDDGPDTEKTYSILEALERENVKAAFFTIGKRCLQNPQIIKTIAEKGHAVENHTFSHSPFFPLFPASKIKKELESASRIIQRLTGRPPRFFRPPAGIKNFSILKTAHLQKLTPVGWTVRSLDSLPLSSNYILKRLKKKTVPGAILALHDGLAVKNKKKSSLSAEELQKLIKHLKSEGYRFVSLEAIRD